MADGYLRSWGDACLPYLQPKIDYTKLRGRNRARYPLRIFAEAECRAHVVEEHHGHYGKLLKRDVGDVLRGHALSPRPEAVEAAWGAWSWSMSGFVTEHIPAWSMEMKSQVLIGYGERVPCKREVYTFESPLNPGSPPQCFRCG